MAVEQTYVMIKPDAVARRLMGEILSRFEKRGFVVKGLKLVQAATEVAESHYAEHRERPFFRGLVEFLASGPVLAMVIEGESAVSVVRSMVGATKPSASAPGTIRGDLALTVGRNVIHASDSLDSAAREIQLWFKNEEIVNWSTCDHKWLYE